MAKKNGTRKNKLAQDFCSCIKKVSKTIKLRPGQAKTAAAKEAAAIGVCVKSVLQTKGRTLKKFRCIPKKPMLQTQKPLRGGAVLVGNTPGDVSQNEFLEDEKVSNKSKNNLISLNDLFE